MNPLGDLFAGPTFLELFGGVLFKDFPFGLLRPEGARFPWFACRLALLDLHPFSNSLLSLSVVQHHI